MKISTALLLAISILFFSNTSSAQGMAGLAYPYPVHYFPLTIERQPLKMAYMDVEPARPNGHTVILFHGKNFNGYYWRDVIAALSAKGYRVIAPDQVGWGKSSKPNIHYSFHLLANNSKKLLDSLDVQKVIVIGHSIGGMLATRFCLLYPDVVEQLVLEDPIGLEDYRTFVPYSTPDDFYKKELKATYESYKKYQQTYYPVWKPAYEDLVRVQAAALTDTAFPRIAFANALTTAMIYEQPVCYELDSLRVPVTFIIGTEDHTIVGGDLLTAEVRQAHGQVLQLAQEAVKRMVVHEDTNHGIGDTNHGALRAQLISIPGSGHIPHIQAFDLFIKALFSVLPK